MFTVPFLLGVVLWNFGQQAAGDAVGLATLLTQIGLSAIFLWQWQAERNLRIKRDEQLFTILEKQGPVLSEAIQTLKSVQESQHTLAANMPKLTEWERLVQEIKDTTLDLRGERRRRVE